MNTVKVIRITEETTTAAKVPTLKTNVQMILRTLVIPKNTCVLKFHTFLTRLKILATAKPVYMKAQIMKKNPGGVTHK